MTESVIDSSTKTCVQTSQNDRETSQYYMIKMADCSEKKRPGGLLDTAPFGPEFLFKLSRHTLQVLVVLSPGLHAFSSNFSSNPPSSDRSRLWYLVQHELFIFFRTSVSRTHDIVENPHNIEPYGYRSSSSQSDYHTKNLSTQYKASRLGVSLCLDRRNSPSKCPSMRSRF